MPRIGFLALALLFSVAVTACGESGTAPAKPSPPRTDAILDWAKVSTEQIAAAEKSKVPVAVENSIGMRFVLIPAGRFTMGSPSAEKGRDADETEHEVELTRPFYLSIHEVTNGQYRRFKADHDSGSFKGESLNGDTQPVVEVSHDDATAFTAWLSGQDRGRVYRLPTESEWEFACRAGTRTARWWGEEDGGAQGRASVLDAVSKKEFEFPWESFGFDDGYRGAAPVGRFAANGWGLYDMLGNAWEWCSDGYGEVYPTGRVQDPQGSSSGSARVLRGASWFDYPPGVRSAGRGRHTPDDRGNGSGFRVVWVAPLK